MGDNDNSLASGLAIFKLPTIWQQVVFSRKEVIMEIEV
jgi:hypothetical protein